MTWGELLKQGQERLKKAGIQEYELDAWYLFERAFSMSRARYFLDAKEEAAPGDEALKAYEDGLERRSGRVPLQHILGTQEFMGMEFFVNAHVLIPRQDTETLVETVLNEQKNRNISVLDMCTGSRLHRRQLKGPGRICTGGGGRHFSQGLGDGEKKRRSASGSGYGRDGGACSDGKRSIGREAASSGVSPE